MSHVRHEDDVKTQKAFVVMYDFMDSFSSQKTLKFDSKFAILISLVEFLQNSIPHNCRSCSCACAIFDSDA